MIVMPDTAPSTSNGRQTVDFEMQGEQTSSCELAGVEDLAYVNPMLSQPTVEETDAALHEPGLQTNTFLRGLGTGIDEESPFPPVTRGEHVFGEIPTPRCSQEARAAVRRPHVEIAALSNHQQ